MGPFGTNDSDASDVDASTGASRVAGWMIGVLLGFDVGQGCGHRNLLQ
jgi:hypothetical protein